MLKKHSLAQLICFTLCLITFLSPILAMADQADLRPPSTEHATAVYFQHLKSNEVIVSQNADLQINAGSTVKILAGLIACERLSDQLSTPITITSEMLEKTGGRRLHLKSGDVLTVEQLLYIALCGSYNDAFDVLAHHISGSLEDFTAEMNTQAKALGATNTVFTDASGIDDNSRTTATDLARIARKAYENELYMKITSTTRYTCPETLKMDAQMISNRNALIYSTTTTQYFNSKCRGMSAGNTPHAGSCVVTVATSEQESYLCIIMGGIENEETDHGYVIANQLIDWVYNSYTYMEVITPETVVCTLPVTVSDMTSTVEIRTKESLSCYLPVGLEIGTDIKYSVRLLYSSLEAPVTEGMMVGYIAILYDGKTVDTLPLYTAGAAERSSFISSLKSIQALTQSRVFRAGAIFFAVVFASWMTVEYILLRRRRHKWDKYFSMKMNPSPTAQKKDKK